MEISSTNAFFCNICFIHAKNKYYLNRHFLSKKHNKILSNPELYKEQCFYCKKKFTTKINVSIHENKCTSKSTVIDGSHKNVFLNAKIEKNKKALYKNQNNIINIKNKMYEIFNNIHQAIETYELDKQNLKDKVLYRQCNT